MIDPLETAETDQPGFEPYQPNFGEAAGHVRGGFGHFVRAAGRAAGRSFDRRMEPIRRGAEVVRNLGARGVQGVRNFGARSGEAVRNFGARRVHGLGDVFWRMGDFFNEGAGPQRRSREDPVEDRSGDRSNTGAEEQRKLRKDRTGAKRGREVPLKDRSGAREERGAGAKQRSPDVPLSERSGAREERDARSLEDRRKSTEEERREHREREMRGLGLEGDRESRPY
jgi:hypothetical protein